LHAIDTARRCKGFPMPSLAPSNTRSVLRRFRRSRRGSAAVEFALVAPVFFALLFAIIESAIFFFASQVLETVTQDSARVLMTGQAQTSLVCTDPASGAPAPCTPGTFHNYVCSQIPGLFNCTDLYVDVESYPAFTNVVINNQIDGSGNFTAGNMQYSPGGACAIVVVRMFYQWPLYVTGFGFNISNLSGNKRLLVATAAFKNEPYGSGSC
jgi:Flp pilus assembly protein TadG